MVVTKYVAIITVEFVHTERSYGIAARGTARAEPHEIPSVKFGVKVYGTAVSLILVICY